MFQANASCITINDSNWQQHVQPPNGQAMGCVPRDFGAAPRGCYFPVYGAPLIPKADQQRLLDEQKQLGARFIDYLRDHKGPSNGMIPSRDQNGRGYCWQHSGVSCMMAIRAMAGLPYEDLSAYGPACIIKNFRDEGGWGAEGCKFLASRGCPTSKTWPQKSTNRANDNPNTWAEAAKYKLSDAMWYEVDGNMKETMISVLLRGGVLTVDYNWWSHSVAAVALESIDPFVIWIWNSWGDSWSQQGLGKLEGSRAVANDSVAVFQSSASA